MIEWEQGLVSRGNWAAIQACMERAAAGDEITVGFLGGSITQGCHATEPELCYAQRVWKWWQNTFPKANIRFVNAGIGATNSQFAVARVDEDLLRYKPDFVLAEFSVNEDSTPHFRETYEGLVRKLLKSGTALMLMNNVFYNTGINAQQVHVEVAQHYAIPSVSMKETIYAALLRGELQNRDISRDDLHPNDYGHDLVARVICHFLERARVAPREQAPAEILPAPLTPNRYEDSRRYQNHNSNPQCQGFVADEEPQEDILQIFRRGYTAWKKGDRISFTVEGSCIGVQYRKSVIQPTPIARITVDGEHEMLLDGNFTETWGDCLHLDTVVEGLEPGIHSVTVEIAEAHENDKVPFYLVSVIGSNSPC